MIFKDLNRYKYLFLKNIDCTDGSRLVIYLGIGIVSEETETVVLSGGVTINDARPILEDNSLIIRVIFPSYVAYNVRWESYTGGSDYDEFMGRTGREYSKSRYLEYVKSDTIASDEWPGKLKHFGICCEWEIIDIVSIDEPQIQWENS